MEDVAILNELENPAVPGMARYQDLDALVAQFFSDCSITKDELTALVRIDEILDAEFMVAQDLIAKMDKNSPLYAAAKEMLEHLYRCRNLIDGAKDRAKVFNELEEAQKEAIARREKEEKEALQLKTNQAGAELLRGLMTRGQRMQAEESFSQKAFKKMNPAQQALAADRVWKLLQKMQETKLNAFQMNKMLSLGREM